MRPIERRIIEAVRRAVNRGYKPTKLYLTAADLRELDSNGPVDQVDGIVVKRIAAQESRLYCQYGTSVSLPVGRRLQP